MNLAIALTGSRLVVAPIFAYFFISAFSQQNTLSYLWGAFICVIAIELSDAFDGIVARSQNKVTDFGKIFDPVCDSLSRLTIFLSFMYVGIIPMWMFLIFMYRDSLMSFFRVMCAVDGTVVAARKSGKLKAIFQAIATLLVLGLLITNQYGLVEMPKRIWGFHPGFWIMVFPAAFTAFSVLDYFLPNKEVFKKRAIPKPQ